MVGGIVALVLLTGAAYAPAQGPATPPVETPDLPAPPDTIADSEAVTEAAATAPQLAEDEFAVDADEVRYVKGALYARGHVRIRHREIEVTGDEGEVDEEGVWAEVNGNVTIRARDLSTTGSRLRVNLDTEEWEITDGETKLEPSALEERLSEPVFVRARTIRADPVADLLVATDAEVTTCDLAEEGGEEVHYQMTTAECRIRPKKDVTLDHPTLHGLGRRIVQYPGVLRIPLDRERSRWLVEVGQSQVEGFYAKIGYPYEAGRSASGLARLNLSTERGVGLGVDHWFDNGQSAGEIDVFAEPQKGAWSTRVRHRFQVNRALSTTLNSSLQMNSGYSSGSTTSLSSDFGIRNDTGSAHTALSFQQYLTSGTGYSSTRLTGNFMHQQRGPAGIDWTLRSTAQRSKYGSSTAADEELEVDFEARREHPAFDWELGFKQRYDLDGGRYTADSQYSVLDELPALVLRSDTERLGMKWGFPIQTRVELGQFRQQPEDQLIQRVSLEGEIYGETVQLAKGHDLRTGAAFRQTFYSEGSAQYDLRMALGLQSSWGGPWYSQLQWDWEQPAGFSPLRLDYAAKNHDVQFGMSHYVANRSRVEIDTGYDIRQSYWRDVILRAEFTPNLHNRFELQTAYDLERSQFRPLELRWQFVRQHRLDLELSTSYDVERSELSRVQLDSDWVISPQWRLESLVGYNGSLQELDFLETRVTRDLHCWVASLAYSLTQKEVRLNFGLKALGGGDWEYGLGGQGEWLSPRSGQYY
jgi:lipopolysaccharide assembly outer membrane protein LptD (OstA)